MLLQISYDLRDRDRDYDDLYEEIKRQGRWWHYLKSTWIIETTRSSRQVVDALEDLLSRGDRLLVSEIDRLDGVLPEKAWHWLERHKTAHS
jgi:alpha-L-fucosidase